MHDIFVHGEDCKGWLYTCNDMQEVMERSANRKLGLGVPETVDLLLMPKALPLVEEEFCLIETYRTHYVMYWDIHEVRLINMPHDYVPWAEVRITFYRERIVTEAEIRIRKLKLLMA